MEEGGADGTVSVRGRRNREFYKLDSSTGIVVAMLVSCSVPPPVRMAVTATEYVDSRYSELEGTRQKFHSIRRCSL